MVHQTHPKSNHVSRVPFRFHHVLHRQALWITSLQKGRTSAEVFVLVPHYHKFLNNGHRKHQVYKLFTSSVCFFFKSSTFFLCFLYPFVETLYNKYIYLTVANGILHIYCEFFNASARFRKQTNKVVRKISSYKNNLITY